MAQIVLTWTPASGSSAGSQDVNYRLLGSPTWLLFASVSASTSTETVTGLTLNKIYEFQIVNNCGLGGKRGIVSEGIVFNCPTADTNSVTYNSVQVTFIPQGGDVTIYDLQLLNSAGTTVLSTHTFTAPFASSISYTLSLPAPNTSYKIRLIPKAVGHRATYSKTNCPLLSVTSLSTCTCPMGYSPSSDLSHCELVETLPPTVTHTAYCLAPSRNNTYGSYFTRVYKPGFASSSINLFTAPSSDVYAELTTYNLWKNTFNNMTDGPVNRDGVWIDSDCDGTANALSVGGQTTVAYAYENLGAARTIYVGIAADNHFVLKVNGTAVATCPDSASSENFRIWHVFPVSIQQGFNDFNAVATGDGSVNDSIAMAVYDNTAVELAAASTLAGLNILFASHTLIGSTIDVATCPTGYSLDTAGGSGNYICRRITVADCNT